VTPTQAADLTTGTSTAAAATAEPANSGMSVAMELNGQSSARAQLHTNRVTPAEEGAHEQQLHIEVMIASISSLSFPAVNIPVYIVLAHVIMLSCVTSKSKTTAHVLVRTLSRMHSV
jgi:hypothetical protein